MLCLKDFCINSIVQIIKKNYINNNNNNNQNNINYSSSSDSGIGSSNILKEIGIQYLTSDILENILKILKNIERWKLNDQVFQVLLDSNINYLDLSNEDKINFNNFIQLDNSCSSSSSNNDNNNNNNNKNNNDNNSSTNNNQYNIHYSLIELNISFNNSIEDGLLFHFLNKLYNLKSLNLSYCTSIEFINFNQLYNISTTLQTLNLRGCTNLTSNGFKNIGKHFKNLNNLVLSKNNICDRDCKYFRKLNRLATLKLNHCNNISSEAIKYISTYKSLKSLYLTHCTLLQAPNSFKSLVDNNSTITTLDISYCLVDDDSIGTIILNNNNTCNNSSSDSINNMYNSNNDSISSSSSSGSSNNNNNNSSISNYNSNNMYNSNNDSINNKLNNINTNNNSINKLNLKSILNENNINTTNDLIKIKSLTSLSIRYNRITPKFLKAISNEKELLGNFKHLDLRQSNFIEVENALCLYPYMCSKDSELYISNNNRSGRRSRFNINNNSDNNNSSNNNSNNNINHNNSNNNNNNNHNNSSSSSGGSLNNDLINLQELYNRYNNKTIASEDQIQLNRSSLRISILERQQHTPLILLGEDEKFQASIVKNVLERKNFDVRIATNGKTAFEMYCETPFFELVIMDIYMPIVNGINSVRMIRQFEKSNNRKRTPIIICSGNESIIRSGNNSSEDIGGDAFITKPFRPNLIDLIIKMTQNTSKNIIKT